MDQSDKDRDNLGSAPVIGQLDTQVTKFIEMGLLSKCPIFDQF